MTAEEARQEAIEAERLINEINRLQHQIEQEILENANLQVELETLVRNVETLADNAETMDDEVNKSMIYVERRVADADITTAELFSLIDELTRSYFTFKNLSTAAKNVTQYTDEYFTKYKFYHELRRISLGYVVGLDAHICSDESMRKKVEQVYLKNTEYWLAYAIMAVMLWSSDEEEAAQRALSKSLSIDYLNSSLFFLLINLRFNRLETAKRWYVSYLDRTDSNHLGKEWQYLLQTYLSGAFGVDEEFNQLVKQYLNNTLLQIESMNPNYGNKVIDKTLQYSTAYIHVTGSEFETLRRNCTEYDQLKRLLSEAEKNEILALHFRETMEMDSRLEMNLFQRIENVLYDLVNSYDKEELKVIKNKRYSEMVIKAKGDLSQAQQFYNLEFPSDDQSIALEDLLFDWAFEEDMTQVDITVKKFAVSFLKKWISKGFSAFADNYRSKEKDKYTIAIDGWEKECNEFSFEEARVDLEKHYNKNRFFDTVKDNYVLIFIGMVLASVLTLAITIASFSKVGLVIGILLGVVGGFLLWRRVSDLQAILKVKREKGYNTLYKALGELHAWRNVYRGEDLKNTALVNVFDNIEL